MHLLDCILFLINDLDQYTKIAGGVWNTPCNSLPRNPFNNRMLRTYSPTSLPLSPWAGFEAVNRLFDRLPFPFAEISDLPVEVLRTDSGASLAFEVPGVEAKDVKVEVEGRSVSVTVERAQPARDSGSVLRAERSYGITTRTIELPFPVNRDSVSASLKDGLLTVLVEPAQEAKPRRIEISS